MGQPGQALARKIPYNENSSNISCSINHCIIPSGCGSGHRPLVMPAKDSQNGSKAKLADICDVVWPIVVLFPVLHCSFMKKRQNKTKPSQNQQQQKTNKTPTNQQQQKNSQKIK